MKKAILNNVMTILINFLFGILPVVVSLIVFNTQFSELPEAIHKKIGISIVVVLIFTVIGFFLTLIYQRHRIVKNKIYNERLKEIEGNDFTNTLDQISMEGDYSESVNSIVNRFHQLLTNVHSTVNVTKQLTGTVNGTSKAIVDVSKQIASASEAVSNGAVQQAEDAEVCLQITSGLIESLENVANMVEDMSEKSRNVSDMTESGKNRVKELIEKSKISESNVNIIIGRTRELNDMASNISEITNTIASIATQTNLLSLNASIEAARAGEMGRGFAVVAGEIKKLAEQSISSSKKISVILNDILKQVSDTMISIDATAETMNSQIESVYATNEIFNGITYAVSGMNEQLNLVKDGFDELGSSKTKLVDSITNIATVAEENAASSEEVTSLMLSEANSGEILIQVSNKLETQINELNASIEGYKFKKVEERETSFALISCVDAPIFQDAFKAGKLTGDKLGIKTFCRAPIKRFDKDEQIKLIKEAIENGVKGIGISPIICPEVKTALNQAIQKGINVICFDADMPDIKRSSFIGTDNYLGGKLSGEIAARILNGAGKVIITVPNVSQFNFSQRIKGFKDGISKFPNINIVEMESSGGSDLEQRFKNIKSIIGKVGAIDCFVVFDASGAALIKRLREELGVKAKTVVFDKSPIAMELLKKDYVDAIVAQRSNLWGELVVTRLNDLLFNKQIPGKEDTGTFEINKRNYMIFDKK
jgi:methyl-accepting chemotaxis protein